MGGKGLDTVSVEKSLQYLFLPQRGKLEALRKAAHAGTRVGNRAQDYREGTAPAGHLFWGRNVM